MEDQKLVTLCGYLSLGGSSNIVANIFAYRGGWYLDYGLSPWHSTLIINDARQKLGDTPFQEVVAISSLAVSRIKAADRTIMSWCCCIAIWRPKIPVQKLLMLRWQSCLDGTRDIIVSIFAHEGGEQFSYGLTPLYSVSIIQDARPEILTLCGR